MHKIPTSANVLLDSAKRLPKGDHWAYVDCKRKLYGLNLEPEQYDFVHREIVRTLKV